jgi:putative ABC transport system ATP-binding protein
LNDAAAIGDAAAIQLTDVRFRWRPRSEFELSVPSLVLGRRERVLLVGPSGSGKSTLLSLISGVAVPQAGKVAVIGSELTALSGAQRDRFRADHLGIIFQMFNLIPYLSAMDNILLPLRISTHRRSRVADGARPEDEAKRLMSRLGLEPKTYARKNPTELSVGQQQRVAAARALIGRPEVIIADEPTSSLDRDRQVAFVTLLREEVQAADAALLLVSHDLSIAESLDRIVRLDDIIAGAAAPAPPSARPIATMIGARA